MAKTTNILDLNNRLEKVEKGNVAQNSYTSLKNKPKINGVTLTGNKSLSDIGSAAAADLTALAGDVGDKSQLNTTDKSSTVAAINEVNNNLKPSSAVLLQANSIPGITFAWENNEDNSHMAYRVGNLVIINVSVFVTGTYSGESTWVNLFEMPSSLLKSGEQFMDSIPVFITASATNGNAIDDNRILRGRQMRLPQNQSIDFHFGYQIIVGVVSQ